MLFHFFENIRLKQAARFVHEFPERIKMNKEQLDKIQDLLDTMINTRFTAGASCLVFRAALNRVL